MKNLELYQMESLQGGEISNRQCMLAGAAVVGGIILGFASFGWGWGVAIVSTVGAADCF
jgi:hypothetical protein